MSGEGFGVSAEIRERVLHPRGAWSRDEWEEIPMISYVRPRAADDEARQNEVAVILRRLMVLVEDTVAQSAPRQFVMLLRMRLGEDSTSYWMTCPYSPVLDRLRSTHGDPTAVAHLADRSADMRLVLRAIVPPDTLTPLVVTCDPGAGHYAFENLAHHQDPAQFLSAARCTTTSGFLSFLGARELHGAPMVLLPALEPLMGQGVDEWLRWVIWMMDVGPGFDGQRLLVKRAEPEKWMYDYEQDPGQEDPSSHDRHHHQGPGAEPR